MVVAICQQKRRHDIAGHWRRLARFARPDALDKVIINLRERPPELTHRLGEGRQALAEGRFRYANPVEGIF